MMCDRSTCGDVDCIGVESLGNIILPSSDEFIANLLHLKCKVIRLARRQIRKEIPGLEGLTENHGHLRSERRLGPPRMKRAASQDLTSPRLGRESITGELKVRESPKKDASSGSAHPEFAQQSSQAHYEPEIERNSFIRWIKSLLSSSLPFYWTIVVIALLGFTSLVLGVLLGAFICSNGSFPFFFFWTRSRGTHVLY